VHFGKEVVKLESVSLKWFKGAPERVWDRCTSIFINGSEEKITPEWTKSFEEAYLALGGLGERVLGTPVIS